MKKFYVTFGVSTIFGGYHARIEAYGDEIVAAWLRREGIKYSSIYEDEPESSKPLKERFEVLHYSKATHV